MGQGMGNKKLDAVNNGLKADNCQYIEFNLNLNSLIDGLID